MEGCSEKTLSKTYKLSWFWGFIYGTVFGVSSMSIISIVWVKKLFG